MFQLITGGSGSGKSSYAEGQTLRASGQKRGMAEGKPCLYIATMKPCGEEALKKIERHRRLREGKGFATIECCQGLDGIRLPKNSGVLLECVSNLAANELYGEDGVLYNRQEIAERILRGIGHILGQTENLVAVTDEVSSDVSNYSNATKEYIALLGMVNGQLACMADRVTEVVYGIPVVIKG